MQRQPLLAAFGTRAADVFEEGARVPSEHFVGRAVDVVAGSGQLDVPLVVLLEGERVAVMAPAVGFDDDLGLGPEEIDEVALN